MTSTDITTIAYNAVFTIGATGTGIWYVFKHGVQNVLRQEFQDIRDIKHEVTPNTGSSLNDAIRKQVIPMVETLVERQQEIAVDVAVLNGRFEQHVREHNG
jgi:hypothetical protein